MESSALTSSELALIEAELAKRPNRVVALQLPRVGDVFIKRMEPARGKMGYTVLGVVSRLLRQPMLRPVYAPGGAEAQRIEVRRLNTLRQSGVNVPKVLHVTADWFVMTSVGQKSLEACMSEFPDQTVDYFADAAQNIAQLHHKGQNLSQAFVRNITCQDSVIGFIDFEDDPAADLGLTLAQARDWLLFAHSSAPLLNDCLDSAVNALRNAVAQDNPVVQQQFHQALRQLTWLGRLPNNRQRWGRDVTVAHHSGQLFKRYLEILG